MRKMHSALICLSLSALTGCASQPGHEASDVSGAAANRIVAHGNEPFWSIEADGTQLLWKTPELPQGKVLDAHREVHAMGTGFTGEDAGNTFSLVIFREPCNDGMSDVRYELTATWTYAGREMRGCAKFR